MTKTAPTVLSQTSVCLVLDRSGSMASCRKEIIDAVNKYLLEARQDDNLKECDFELLTFDSASIDQLRAGAPVRVADLTAEDYTPRASTPLYDAIGRGIDNLDAKLAASGSGKAILVIVTDGAENASRKYNRSAIAELIKTREAAGWLVVFLAKDLEAANVAVSLGVRADTVATMDFNETGLRNMAQSIGRISGGYASNATNVEAKAWKAGAHGKLSMSERKGMGDKLSGATVPKTPRDPVVGLAAEGDTWASDKPKDDAWSQ